MLDYETLYHRMLGASEDALAALETGDPERARFLLLEAERNAEDAYVEQDIAIPLTAVI